MDKIKATIGEATTGEATTETAGTGAATTGKGTTDETPPGGTATGKALKGETMPDKAAPDTVREQLLALVTKSAGRRLTRAGRDDLGRLGEVLRDEGTVCDVVGAAVLNRRNSGLGPVLDLDLDLLDAALAAGVPVADPPPGTVLSLSSWRARTRRGGLVAVAADPRFRPLLHDALLDRRGDLLAFGRPGTVLRDETDAADAFLAAPGLLGILRDAVDAWAAAVAAGSLPALHEAVHYLDLIGPARLADACPQARAGIAGLLRSDVAELLAATWRSGLADELGDPALDAYASFTHSDDVYRMAPDDGTAEDAFVVTNGHRSVLFGPRGVIAGPLYSRFPNDTGSSRTPHRFRYAQGRFDAVPTPGSAHAAYAVSMPAAAHPNALRRTPGGWWDLCSDDGAVLGRWYQGAARPARVSGSHSAGRRRHRWAAGSELMPPAPVWGRLTARDPAGSRALRTAHRALAARVLDAAGRELAERVTEIGRRVPVCNPSHEVDEAFDDLRDALAPSLPGVTADRLLDGIAGTVWSALECRVLIGRHVVESGTASPATVEPRTDDLRALPLPYPRADPGDLRARIFTGMQEMFLRLGAVAEACADPKLATPPQSVRLENALGWESSLGRLGGRALRTVLHPLGPDRSNDLRADGVRAWGVAPVCDPAGRWRTLSLRLETGNPPQQGTVCRTPRGCVIMLQTPRSGDLAALEYAADGVFAEAPFGTISARRVCRGWGGADRVAELLRLLDARGPAPWPTASVEAFAEATGRSVAEATLLAVGFDPYDAYLIRRGNSGLPAALAERCGVDAGSLADAGKALARDVDIDHRQEVPELLMPDAPEDLWSDRLDVARAALWWNTRGSAA